MVDLYHGQESEDPGERMEALAQELEDRIQDMLREEKESGTRYPYLARDVQGLASLRKAILKWEVSHPDPLGRKESEKIRSRMDRQFKGLLSNLSDDGERVIRAAERFLQMAEEQALTLQKNEDGTYTAVEDEK
jgi:hypothetical protein